MGLDLHCSGDDDDCVGDFVRSGPSFFMGSEFEFLGLRIEFALDFYFPTWRIVITFAVS